MKIVQRVAAAVALLLVAYAVAAFALGRVIVSETVHFSEALSAQPGVTVRRLDYEAGLLGGTLRYDFDYAPPPDSLLAATGWTVARTVRGEMPMRHGPWVGDGFALATGHGRVEVPEDLRRELPGLTADRPLIESHLRIPFDRSVHATFIGLEHDGPLTSDYPGARHGMLRLAGVEAHATFDAALNRRDLGLGVRTARFDVTEPVDEAGRLAVEGLRVRADLVRVGADWTGPVDVALAGLDIALPEGDWRMAGFTSEAALSVVSTPYGERPGLRGRFVLDAFDLDARGDHPVRLHVAGMQGLADAVEEWPQMWTGTSSLGTGPIDLFATGGSVRWDSFVIESETVRRDALLDQTLTFRIGPVAFDDARLGGGRLTFFMKGVDGAALSELVEVLSRHAVDPPQASDDEVAEVLLRSAETIFAGAPAVAIDYLGLSVLEEADLQGRIEVSLRPAQGAPMEWAQLSDRVRVQGGARAALGAVRHLIRLSVATELRGHGLSGHELDAIAEARLDDWLQRMRESPYVAVIGDAVSTQIGYADGMLTFNGAPVDPTLLLFMLALAGAALGS